MNPGRDAVIVRVPGSTSNCGAGFDTLGLALNLHNRVTLRRGTGTVPRAERDADARAADMVGETAELFFRAAKISGAGFTYRIEGEVPPARGLGSSVTVIAGVLAGLDALHGTRFSKDRLVELATEIEGHPDNASSGVLGGFCVSRCDPNSGAYLGTVRIPIARDVVFVVAVPQIELLTKESRGALPTSLAYFDAVKSINSAAYFTAVMASRDYEKLRDAVADFMHEPYRLPKIPGARASIVAGIAAGAYTGWLSGSGSSVLCMAKESAAEAVGAAMSRAFVDAGVPCESKLLYADNDGLVVEGA